MKVLWIGGIDITGWGQQNTHSILAADEAGIDIYPVDLNINSEKGEMPERLKELLKKKCRKPDFVVQNVLPFMAEYHGGVKKNIVYYMTETTNFTRSCWQNRINLMDEAWVPCAASRKASLDSGVKIPVKVVHLAIDASKKDKAYKKHRLREIYPDDFIFYTVGEFTSRKNLETIVRAFHSEFGVNEPVQLYIKTTPVGLGGNPLQDAVDRVQNIKRGLKIFTDLNDYKKDLIEVSYASEDQLYSLYNACDCFVSASHSEAWCIPAADAAVFGKQLIVPRYGGFHEYLNDKNAFFVEGVEDYMYGALDCPLADIYVGDREKWFNPSVDSMRKQMRAVFKGAKKNKADMDKFSYKAIGNLIKKTLEA